MLKIIVAHPGQQHSYKVASELKKNNMLFKYITTVYDKSNSILMKCVKIFLSKENYERANSRKNLDLTDEEVVLFNQFEGLIEIALSRFDKKQNIYRMFHYYNSDRFGRKVARYAIKNHVDAVILYDTNAMKCFQILMKKNPNILRIMDVSAANRLYMKKIYENDFKLCPKFSDKLKKERGFLWEKGIRERLEKEIEYTQMFVVPSKFVKDSLLYSGVDDKDIYICPYGSNFLPEKNIEKKVKEVGRLEAVYVGNVTEMKGIFYLLEAIKQTDINRIHLTIVGAYENSDGLLDQYMDIVTFTGRIMHDKVEEILKKSDFFVFPSLGEGLSLSVLEALACGLPCIVTKNSGANDAIENGENGFVVDIQDSDALLEKMLWFDQNRDKIPEMSKRAVETITKYNWNNHEQCLIKAIQSRLHKERKGISYE